MAENESQEVSMEESQDVSMEESRDIFDDISDNIAFLSEVDENFGAGSFFNGLKANDDTRHRLSIVHQAHQNVPFDRVSQLFNQIEGLPHQYIEWDSRITKACKTLFGL